MKISFFNKKLLLKVKSITSPFFAISTVFMSFVDLIQKDRLILLGILVVLSVGIYLFELYKNNNLSSKKVVVNGTKIEIKFGDIFKEKGQKLIAFNEFFDTQVDDKIISSGSLNGKFIKKYCNYDKKTLDEMISHSDSLKKIDVNNRIHGGKSVKYALGSLCKIDDYFIMAFSHFDAKNRAYLSVSDYIICLLSMWNELNCYYDGEKIILPLLGSGITRFNDAEISDQELLNYILFTLQVSRINFKSGIKIVIGEDLKKEINLFEIGE